jgi:hypothetical protein
LQPVTSRYGGEQSLTLHVLYVSYDWVDISGRTATAYLKNGGKLEIAQQIAAHESSRTTGLYVMRI